MRLRHLLSFLFYCTVQAACPVKDLARNSITGSGIISINSTQYTEALDCRWTISNNMSCPNNGNPIITIVWGYVDTEPAKDQITIYDGASIDARKIQQVSGNRREVPLNSSGSTLYVTFLTDEDNQGETGFAFSYTFSCGPAIQIDQTCKPATNPTLLSVAASGGKIEFTDSRASYQDCFWVISNDLPSCNSPYLEAEFTNFSASFPYDYLELYDGQVKNPPNQIGHYQGPKVYYGPGVQRSTGRTMMILFHNEYAHPGTDWSGFMVKFTAKCNQQPGNNCPLRSAPKVFDHASYMVFSPAHYRPAENCYWLFKNTNRTCEQPVVLLIFPVFRTTELYDTVTLWDGSYPGAPGTEIGKWSGSAYDAVPLGFQRSTGPAVLLEFHSGSLYTEDFNRGFTVQFAFPCGEDLPKANEATCPPYLGVDQLAVQNLTTTAPQILNFTSASYRNNLDCGWVYSNANPKSTCPNGSVPIVQLEFLHFETEPNFDYLNIYDAPIQRRGDAYDDYYLLGSFSGSRAWEIPTVIRSTESSIMVTFHSDGTVSDLDEDGSHNDGVQFKATAVCSTDPLPTAVNYDCRSDSGMPYAKFWTNTTLQNPRVTFGHHYLPFNLAYPTIIEQFFTNANPRSFLSSRNATGVSGEVVIGYDKLHAGGAQTWRCCGSLATLKPVAGSILVCERGDCLFVEKVRVAQNAGAVGVIIVDTSENGVRMGSTVDVSDLTIPSVSTISSFGTLLLNTTARTTMYASLLSFVCPQGTYSPTTTPVDTDSPTPLPFVITPTSPPSYLRAPTPPTNPTMPPPNATMYFTLPLDSTAFNADARARFMISLNSFFGWAPGVATLGNFAPDPEDNDEMVAEVIVDEPRAEAAFARWGFASSADKLMLSPAVLSVSRHVPHSHCVPINCESTSLQMAEWDTFKCTCSWYITGAGVFVYIILPIMLFCVLMLLICCCCPFCPFYNRWKRVDQRHQKVAMDDMHTQGVKMMPRGVKDSEESMRGEGIPEDTDDPPAARRDWDEVDRNRGSALVRPSEADHRPIHLGSPKSDESDDERDTSRAY